MIILDNGFTVDGEFNTSIVKINDEWLKIIIVKSELDKDEAESLFKNNRTITYGDKVYVSNGYIKTIQENNRSYTWLRFDYSYSKKSYDEEMKTLSNYILDVDMRLVLQELGL